MEKSHKKCMFSIITVCLNSSKTIEKTFKSILEQQYGDFEYLVIDGKSDDGTLDIIKRYETEFHQRGIRMSWISELDQGIYDAMNKGIRMSNGNIIGILNSDDVYMPWTLETMRPIINENPNVDVFHGLCRFVSNGKTIMIRGLSSDELWNIMLEHPTCFVRRETYEKYGNFDTAYKFVADYDLMLRIKLQGGTFYLVESILAQFDLNGAGNSKAAKLELLQLQKRYQLSSKSKLLFNRVKVTIENR